MLTAQAAQGCQGACSQPKHAVRTVHRLVAAGQGDAALMPPKWPSNGAMPRLACGGDGCHLWSEDGAGMAMQHIRGWEGRPPSPSTTGQILKTRGAGKVELCPR